jgi:hypothetical protein
MKKILFIILFIFSSIVPSLGQAQVEIYQEIKAMQDTILMMHNKLMQMEMEGTLYAETRKLKIQIEDKTAQAQALIKQREGLDRPITQGDKYLSEIIEKYAKSSQNKKFNSEEFMRVIDKRVIILEGYLICGDTQDSTMILGKLEEKKVSPYYLKGHKNFDPLMIKVQINSGLRIQEYKKIIEPMIAKRIYESLPYDDYCLQPDNAIKVRLEGVLETSQGEVIIREWILLDPKLYP